ncbi:KTSC domain-containing protein [Alphaproteobacteria bacterium HT1-32]|nr:KTSC domain-containing protein [Alphaproteobacteria bacterium HT1-32]
MPYVDSTAITRIEHDSKTLVLSIWFTDNPDRYDYYGVPESVYKAFLQARSKGTFFNDHIRDQYSAR